MLSFLTPYKKIMTLRRTLCAGSKELTLRYLNTFAQPYLYFREKSTSRSALNTALTYVSCLFDPKRVQLRFLGSCPPTPPLIHNFAPSEKEMLLLIQGRGRLAVTQKFCALRNEPLIQLVTHACLTISNPSPFSCHVIKPDNFPLRNNV